MKPAYWTITLCLLALLSTELQAQYHKEKCLEGNCKNGFGLKKVEGNKFSPFAFDQSPSSSFGAQYFYYVIGQFKGGQLNGNGYRFDYGLFGDPGTEATIIKWMKERTPVMPDSKHFSWFESGSYVNGSLEGNGFVIEYDTRLNRPQRIHQGQFKGGLLEGPGIKIIPDSNGYLFSSLDASTQKIDVTAGRIFIGTFKKNICTACTLTEKKERYGEGHMTGDKINEDFLTGWVIKDFEENTNTRKFTTVVPYRALYIGGFQVGKLEGTSLSSNQKTIDLGKEIIYTGEIDEKGVPYGFGRIQYPGPRNEIYEGQFDNGKPNGFGYYYTPDNPAQPIAGGFFRNDRIMYGAVIIPRSDIEVILFGDPDGKTDPQYNTQFYDVMWGAFKHYYYTYDRNKRTWSLIRQTSGRKENGYVKDLVAQKGLTDAEKRKQRIVTNGRISISDLVVGDVIVVNGKASPVVSVIASVFTMKNGKTISSLTVNEVRLSKYRDLDFHQACSVCSGHGHEEYIYTRPPEQVEEFYYVNETVVGDYTVLTHPVLQKRTVTKTYRPEKRVLTCPSCNGSGATLDVKELSEP